VAARGTVIVHRGVRATTYRIKYRDASGKQVQETLGSESDGWTYKRAEEALADKMAEVRAGYRKPKRRKFRDYAPECVERHCKRKMLKQSTIRTYRHDLKKHLLPHFGNYELAAIESRPELIDNYIEMKVDEGLSPKSINNTLRLLNVILKRAVRERIIRVNPLDSVDRPLENQADMEILRGEEIERLNRVYRQRIRRTISTERSWWQLAYTVTFFCLLTALRRSELRIEMEER
jgi:hypothetical protein